MALIIQNANRNKNVFVLPWRVYVNAAGVAVLPDSPDRLTLVGAVGAAIPLARAIELGIAAEDGTPIPLAPPDDEEEEPEDGGGTEAVSKAVGSPPATKAVTAPPRKKKGAR